MELRLYLLAKCLYYVDFANVSKELSDFSSRLNDLDTAGQFEWVDSVLVRALKYGHWLLISNANLCK